MSQPEDGGEYEIDDDEDEESLLTSSEIQRDLRSSFERAINRLEEYTVDPELSQLHQIASQCIDKILKLYNADSLERSVEEIVREIFDDVVEFAQRQSIPILEICLSEILYQFPDRLIMPVFDPNRELTYGELLREIVFVAITQLVTDYEDVQMISELRQELAKLPETEGPQQPG